MASGVTNRYKYMVPNWVFRGTTLPSNYYIALVTDTPDEDTNTMSDLTEIAAGNGYTSGGYQLDLNSTDFDVLTEDDTANTGYVEIKDVSWTASGGSIPDSGDGALFAVLTDDDGTVGDREVYAYFDLGSARTVSDGQTLTLQGMRVTYA